MFLRLLPIVIFFSFILFLGFSQNKTGRPAKQFYLDVYRKADRIYQEGETIGRSKNYSEERENKINHDALIAFRKLLNLMENENPGYDSLAFHCYLKLGVLEHFFDNLPAAKKAYSLAMDKQFAASLPDSLLFRPLLYTGIILYRENQFDSALSLYKRAEKIAEAYSNQFPETERLYNTLGALYNETGNYRQAKNYFEKALAVITRANPYYDDLVINYRINLASVLTRLEEYDEANKIYVSVLPVARGVFRNAVLHNTGMLHLNLGAAQQAISYFKQVKYSGAAAIRLMNDFALAYYDLNKKDSAEHFIKTADELNNTENGSRKSTAHGHTLKQWGDLLAGENRIKEALAKYQEAITNFYIDFNVKDIYVNPGSYSGIFSYIPLFHALRAKADAFILLYKQDKDQAYLRAALNTYRSAFALADYVEKSYDSDEARLFLNKIKYTTHSTPIDISLELYDSTGQKEYFEQAWMFDQRNKASVLSLSIAETRTRTGKIPSDLSEQEAMLKSSLTRLSLKAISVTDSIQLNEIKRAILDHEIELGKLQEKIMSIENTALQRPADRIPSAKQVQKLLDANTALLSYHLSETELTILYLAKKESGYIKIPAGSDLKDLIEAFVRNLHKVNQNTRSYTDSISTKLYSMLIEPVWDRIKNLDRLIIIPDDELNYIPFDALKGEDNKYFVEKFSIQYQYSAALLEKTKKKYAGGSILSFAPFASEGSGSLSRLNHSGEEIKNLGGRAYSDREASKETFLSTINKFSIVHLATHAEVNDTDPQLSFIAFNPRPGVDSINYLLYAGEIYNLNLDSTKLVILSACETGAGRLIHGEGLMSLSRAFAYAGCTDIITSLWKAEDRTTAFLMQRFHLYLEKGNSTDRALQKAKLDMLKSEEMDPRFKSPDYWAHLIFIGQYESKQTSAWYWWPGGLALIALSLLFFIRRKIFRHR